MNSQAEARQALKQDLLRRAAELGQEAVLPTQKAAIDAIVRQLESLNPTPEPLALCQRALLLGDWSLIYASRGTVVTRRLVGGISINAIWQRLDSAGERAIAATNGAELELPVIGKIQLQAEGLWRWQGETQTATVSLDIFSLQATELFSQASWQLPALQIPILEWLRREASWQTSYLDSDLRIGRGATGNLFVFLKAPQSGISAESSER